MATVVNNFDKKGMEKDIIRCSSHISMLLKIKSCRMS